MSRVKSLTFATVSDVGVVESVRNPFQDQRWKICSGVREDAEGVRAGDYHPEISRSMLGVEIYSIKPGWPEQ